MERLLARSTIAALCALAAPLPAPAQTQTPAPPVTLLHDVRIFDGSGSALSAPSQVLVRGNRIERIVPASAALERPAGATVIDGGGRTLMPGLIDMHWHTVFMRPSHSELLSSDVGYLNLMAGAEATATLMRGFTTVRDMGGPAFALKRAIDEGILAGPRVYPSGAMISVTSGHGDFAGRPAAGRRQPARQHPPDRRPGPQLRRHHEGRQGLQEHAGEDAVGTRAAAAIGA
ncbi:MAG: amidohydrolase family protein [Burkholderiales bacterium]|nr:amidohydrolase family protein [Burkholderiales bacterium]